MLELQHIVSGKSIIVIVEKGSWPDADPHQKT